MMTLWWLVLSFALGDDTCEQIVSVALEAPENHRPYVVFTQCQKNPPDFLANSSTRTCMEFARLFSLARHYNNKMGPSDFCATTLGYKDSEFMVDPLVKDHKECINTVSGLFESVAVESALRTVCQQAQSSVVLDCERYVTEVAQSVEDGVMDGARLCDRVLTGKETTEFDASHFLYSCVQYAHRGESADKINTKCQAVADAQFCARYATLVSKGADRSEIEAYCQHQAVKLHSRGDAPSQPMPPGDAEIRQVIQPVQATSILAPQPAADADLNSAGKGIPHVQISANMFNMCQDTIDKVSGPGVAFNEASVVQECERHLRNALLPQEVDVLGERLVKGCQYFSHKFVQARREDDFSRDMFCRILTKQSPGSDEAAGPIKAQPMVARPDPESLKKVPWGDGKGRGALEEVAPIMINSGSSSAESIIAPPRKTPKLRKPAAQSFVDTTPTHSHDGEEEPNSFMNSFLSSFSLGNKRGHNAIPIDNSGSAAENEEELEKPKVAPKKQVVLDTERSPVDDTLENFLKAYGA